MAIYAFKILVILEFFEQEDTIKDIKIVLQQQRNNLIRSVMKKEKI